MNITVSEWIYGAALTVAGLAVGWMAALHPAFFEQVPALMVLLLVGLVIDIAIHLAAIKGWLQPLAMQSRFVAFMLGALIMLALIAVMGRA